MTSETEDLSKKRFLVSIYEIHQEIAFADEFFGKYLKTVTLADGSTRTVELTPMMRNGLPVVELNDTGHCSYMGTTVRVASSTTINGNLMIQIVDLDDLDAARAEWLKTSVLPPETSLTSMPEFVPAGFVQGIEILNDATTPMEFVVDVLGAHAGLSRPESLRTMLAIHRLGGALVPTPSMAEAQRIAVLITADAAKQGYPLVCRAVG